MKNKIITRVLLVFVLLFFAVYFITINMTLKQKYLNELEVLEEYAEHEQFTDIVEHTKSLQVDWQDDKFWLTINYAEAEFAMFEEHLNYVIGGAMAEELDTTIGNIRAAKTEWINATKIVPQP